MRQISATQFKARCLALMDEVAAGGEVLQITKHGKAVAELRPVTKPRASSPFGVASGGAILRDLISPVLDPSEWEALRP
jgi:prevent-host-death family protein